MNTQDHGVVVTLSDVAAPAAPKLASTCRMSPCREVAGSGRIRGPVVAAASALRFRQEVPI